jgi:hypothetical protein
MNKDNRRANTFVKLEDYIPAAGFRTVLPGQLSLPHAPAEILVDIYVSEDFGQSLDIYVPWDGALYGYVTAGETLKAFFGKKDRYRAERVYLNDWNDKFLLVMEDKSVDGKEQAFFTTTDEVRYLLEHCRIAREF